jgi:uncharacterized ferritin-like protein (DUF455 family)
MSLNFIFSAKTNVIKKEIIKKNKKNKNKKNTEQNCIWIILSKVDKILLITPCRLQRKKLNLTSRQTYKLQFCVDHYTAGGINYILAQRPNK